jgi:hypothetical protein
MTERVTAIVQYVFLNRAGFVSFSVYAYVHCQSARSMGNNTCADCASIRPCPYGCAYGAGQCINKIWHTCIGEGLQPSSSVVWTGGPRVAFVVRRGGQCALVLSCLLCLNSGKLTNLMTNTAHVGKRPRNFVCIDFTFSYHCFWRCTLFPRNTFPRFHIQLSLLLDMYSCFRVFTRALRTVLHRFCQIQFASHCECIHLSTYMPRWELATYCVFALATPMSFSEE